MASGDGPNGPHEGALVAAKEYRFLSPVFMHDMSGRIMRLKGAGLVHAPNLELTALSRQEIPMDSTAALAAIARIAAALDLPEDAGVDEILAALGELKSQNRATEPDPAKYVPIGAVTDLMRSHRSQSQAMSDRDAEARATTAMNAGHITPAMKDWAVSLCRQDPAGFDAFVSSSPAPYAHLFKSHTAHHRQMPGRAVDAETAAFCRQLDIDPASLDG